MVVKAVLSFATAAFTAEGVACELRLPLADRSSALPLVVKSVATAVVRVVTFPTTGADVPTGKLDTTDARVGWTPVGSDATIRNGALRPAIDAV